MQNVIPVTPVLDTIGSELDRISSDSNLKLKHQELKQQAVTLENMQQNAARLLERAGSTMPTPEMGPYRSVPPPMIRSVSAEPMWEHNWVFSYNALREASRNLSAPPEKGRRRD